jgi:hypothetical protein
MFVDRNNSEPKKDRPQGRSRRRWLALVLASTACLPAAGCTAWTGVKNTWYYNGYFNESVMGFRHQSMASKAWHSRKHCFANQQYLKDFARGFKAGYIAIANGDDGCTPAFPPREYWGWKYQSCEGQARVAAWYAGFPYGAKAAEEDGVGGWTQIQSSAGIQNEYVQHGLMPTEYGGMYPVPPLPPAGSPVPTRGAMTSEEVDPAEWEWEEGVTPQPGGFDVPLPIQPIPDPSIQ